MNKLYSIVTICLLVVICMGIYFSDGYIIGHDSFYHLSNTIALKDSISKENLLGTKIIDKIGNDFGYGKNYFYGPLPHTIVAYMDLIIDNVVLSMKLYNILTVIASAVFMYFLAYKLSKSHKLSIMSAIIYSAYPYHLSNIMIRDSLAETTVFMFLPIILLAIYQLFNKQYKSCFILFTIGYTGLLLSHLVITVYFTIFIVILLLLNIKKVFNKNSILCLGIASICILLITSSFWVPLLEAKNYTEYEVFKEGIMAVGIENFALDINQLNPFHMGNYKYVHNFIPISVFGLIFLGIITGIYIKIKDKVRIKSFFNTYFIKKTFKNESNSMYFSVLILLIIAVIMCSKIFPWAHVPEFLKFIQFPWRLNSFIALFIALLLPLTIKVLIIKNNKFSNMIFIVIILLLCFESNLYSYHLHDAHSFIDPNGIDLNTGMGYQKEYLPVKTHENYEYFKNRSKDIICLNNKDVSIQILEDENNILKFKVDKLSSNIEVEFPKIAYVGYTLKDSDNNLINVYEGENGFLKAAISNNDIYTLEHTGTVLNKIVNIISTIASVTFIIFLIYYLSRNYKAIIKNINFKGDDIMFKNNILNNNSMKNKLYEIFITNKLLIFIIIPLIFFAIFINMQYALDTYSVFSQSVDSILSHIASCGRFITVIFLYITMVLFRFSESQIHLISFSIASICMSISMYKVYNIFKKEVNKNVNKKLKRDILIEALLIISSVLIIINIFSIELFIYIEKAVMIASILFSVLAFERFVKWYNDKKIINILLAILYMFLANCSYQGTVGIFAVLSFIYIAKNYKNIKEFIGKNIIIGIIYVLPALTNLTIIKMFFYNSRVGAETDIIESISKVINNTKNMIILTYGILPKYMLLCTIFLLTILTIICILKNKDKIFNKITNIFLICYIGIGTILITVMPYLVQNTDSIWFVPRSSYSYACLLGALLLFIIIKFNINNKTKIILIFITSIIIMMQLCSFINLAIDNNIINYKDKEIAEEIINLMRKYEYENNINIKNISFYYDKNPDYTYDSVQALGDMNAKALFPSWSAEALIEYYSGESLVAVENDKTIKEKFSLVNYDKFNDSQIIFMDDTIHICLY